MTPELTAAPESTMAMDLDGCLLDVGTIVDCACVGQVDYHDPSESNNPKSEATQW